MQKRTGEFLTKATDKIFFFDALIFSPSYLQTKSGRRKFKKNFKLGFFRALKCSHFLKSVPRTGNELADDNVERCENSQLTLTNL